MASVDVLIEVEAPAEEAFSSFSAALESERDGVIQAEEALGRLSAEVEVDPALPPVPMFTPPGEATAPPAELEAFASADENAELPRTSLVIAAQVDLAAIPKLNRRKGVRVWPNSELMLLGGRRARRAGVDTGPAPAALGEHPFDLARSRPGVDCSPFRPAVGLEVVRELLGVAHPWADGFRGQNVVVGIIDEGVNGDVYPVAGGFSRPNAQAPGTASIQSHGSMCAADVLVAAPAARLYDYPFLGVPNSGGAIAMFQAVLEQRRRDGTPQITSNSYGFVGVPDPATFPNHEVHDIEHPLHRKVREVVASGAACFFAAGNCGANCPSGSCLPSGIGPGKSIHGSNSLAEVITVAAVNSRHERIGYSSQGPGMFEPLKPDVAAYSHLFGNFGPGRPAGTTDSPFDNGTSAATPVAAGVGALLLSAFPELTPEELCQALKAGAIAVVSEAPSPDYGCGVVNAAASYTLLERVRLAAAPAP